MNKMNRRQFLKNSTATIASLTVVSRHVLGGPDYVAPSDKLNIAGIGVGGQGGGDISRVSSENIVALCDVDWKRAEKTFEKFPQAKRYRDFRKMLEKQKDIDAVVVATPDHVHAVAAVYALKMEKHVYLEKPLAHTIHEVRILRKTAKEAGVATQMGNQGHAEETMRLLKEWLDDGAIGKVRKIEAWTPHPVWPQGIYRPKEQPPVPDYLSWDLWLGPAPYRPYHPAYLPAAWRGWWDFGTGALGDMGCHIFDPVFYALELSYPSSVEASYSIFVPETMNWDKPKNEESYPRASIVRYQFPERANYPPLKLTWYDGGLMPERPEELEEGRRMGSPFGGLLFFGDKGKILCGSHGAESLRLIPEKRMKEYQLPKKTLPRSIGHFKEWITACKGGKPAGSNFDYAAPLTETVLLGNIAIRTGQRMIWDTKTGKIKNPAEANKYLKREYRKGWDL